MWVWSAHDVAVDRADITATLVRRVIAQQFPQWSDLAVTPVEVSGWDNVTFRLGDRLSVRLPSGDHYVSQVAKEHRWLRVLAPQLPLPIPEPIALGVPGCGFPRPWSVYRWLPGRSATADQIRDFDELAMTLADFLLALQSVEASAGPTPRPFGNRGGPLAWWDDYTRQAIASLASESERDAFSEAWEHTLAAPVWDGPPLWVHGDVSANNLLVDQRGHLAAVIDFGSMGVGDPACDLAFAWTFLDGSSRETYRQRLAVDDATWRRGQGWALWKAIVVHVAALATGSTAAETAGLQMGWRINALTVIKEVVADMA